MKFHLICQYFILIEGIPAVIFLLLGICFYYIKLHLVQVDIRTQQKAAGEFSELIPGCGRKRANVK
jgi:hypothetical protein